MINSINSYNPLLKSHGINKSNPGVKALVNVSLKLNREEVVALLGGAGLVSAVDLVTFKVKDVTDLDESINAIPNQLRLEQNLPNPCNPSTEISYQIPQQSNIKLDVFNVPGELVRRLVDGRKNPGQYRVTFDGSNLSSGIYLYRL